MHVIFRRFPKSIRISPKIQYVSLPFVERFVGMAPDTQGLKVVGIEEQGCIALMGYDVINVMCGGDLVEAQASLAKRMLT